ncbi:hypothetical protein QZH41_020068 [Actinostola sp. cb2023]|nr:hypothetical protein QZH41_020068 [Actinostola sp. cb2023]
MWRVFPSDFPKNRPIRPSELKRPRRCKVVKEEFEAKFSEQELRERLSPEQYHVTQEKGTESVEHILGMYLMMVPCQQVYDIVSIQLQLILKIKVNGIFCLFKYCWK